MNICKIFRNKFSKEYLQTVVSVGRNSLLLSYFNFLTFTIYMMHGDGAILYIVLIRVHGLIKHERKDNKLK